MSIRRFNVHACFLDRECRYYSHGGWWRIHVRLGGWSVDIALTPESRFQQFNWKTRRYGDSSGYVVVRPPKDWIAPPTVTERLTRGLQITAGRNRAEPKAALVVIEPTGETYLTYPTMHGSEHSLVKGDSLEEAAETFYHDALRASRHNDRPSDQQVDEESTPTQ